MDIFLIDASPDPYKKSGGEKAHRRSEKGGITRRQIQFPQKYWVAEVEIMRI
jgi:hypothetical protein